jgi:hypothetical protein
MIMVANEDQTAAVDAYDYLDGLMDDLSSDYIDLAKAIGFTGSESHDEIMTRAVMLWEKYKLGVNNG